MIGFWQFAFSLSCGAAAWVFWGWLAFTMGWLEMGPDEYLRSTFSLRFWRTGLL